MVQLKNENSQLRGQKRVLEEITGRGEGKGDCELMKKPEKLSRKLRRKGPFYKKKFVQLAKKVIKNNKKGRGPAKKKFNDYSKHHQKRIINRPDGRTQTNIIKESALHQSGLLPLYNMSNTRTSISSDIQTQRSELKNEAEPSFSQPTSRCLMNTL